MTTKPNMNDGVTVTRTIDAFTAINSTDGHTVVVRQDDDLDIKFKRGEVAPHNSGERQVALVLGVDGEPIDLVLFHGTDVREALLEVREAAELALMGLEA